MILQKREKIILLICLATALSAILYIFVVEPLSKKWVGVNEELKAKQTLLEKSRHLLSQKELLARELKKIQKVNYTAGTCEEYAAKFLWQLENIGRQARIKQITSVNPLPVKKEKDYQLLQIQLSFEAELAGLVKYLYNLQNSSYSINIERLQIDNNSEDLNVLKSQILVSSVFFEPGDRQ